MNKVLGVTNLYIVETVDSEKLASTLDNAWPKFRKSDDSKLKIMVQVNTSKEDGNTIFKNNVYELKTFLCSLNEEIRCRKEWL